MNNETKLGLYLLFPPSVLWVILLVFFIDNTLAQYVSARLNAQLIGNFVLIAGLIFPGTAFFVGIYGLVKKLDKKINLVVTILSALMLILLAGILIIYR